MNIFDTYKPLRNKIKKYDLEKSLIGFWRYANHISDNTPLPSASWYFYNGTTYIPPREVIFPWQLEIALKELVLNCSEKGDVSIDQFHNFGTILDGISKTINAADGINLDRSNIFNGILRILHQQVVWQAGIPFRSMLRYYEIFKHPDISALLLEKYGLNATDIFLISHLLLVSLKQSPFIDLDKNFTEIGIPKDLSYKLLYALIDNLENTRACLKNDQEYNNSWAYTKNHLRSFPLIKLKNGRIICPFPSLLHKRLTEGLYFDFVKNPTFSNPYGHSYENHIFNVITKTFPSNYEVKKETPYTVNKNKKHGFDALIGSKNTCLLIECKTYRAPLLAISSQGGEEFKKAITRLIDAVIQTCKNVKDIADGHTSWNLSDRKIVVFIITLEPWFLDGLSMFLDMDAEIETKLKSKNFDMALYSTIDYYICSADQFEKFCHITSQVGLDNFLQKTDKKSHSINSALDGEYSSHRINFPHTTIFELVDKFKERVNPYFDEAQF
ncbi:hypothetical protein [Chromobacterium vaccinii]|uniref:hypothetical protein n=1 Tax=Chromobacterium vaccinii TaxID=1108595 RepID=UPI000A498817|nr:hypothetical protein [Chromobacterium vaccinii]